MNVREKALLRQAERRAEEAERRAEFYQRRAERYHEALMLARRAVETATEHLGEEP